MEITLKRSLFIILLIGLTGCSLKSNDDLIELKPNLNNLTKRANNAIERRGVAVNDVAGFLITKDPILMENFKDYDLKIDNDYTNDNKECGFYVQNPICEK